MGIKGAVSVLLICILLWIITPNSSHGKLLLGIGTIIVYLLVQGIRRIFVGRTVTTEGTDRQTFWLGISGILFIILILVGFCTLAYINNR